MPQLVESCGMFFYAPFSPFRFLLFRLPRKKHAFLFCFVSELCYLCSINQYTQLFAVSKIYADESTHSKYK